MPQLIDVVRMLGGGHPVADIIAAYQAALDEAEADRREAYTRLGVPPGETCPASAVYRRDSRMSHGWRSPLDRDAVRRLTLDLAYKRYPGAPRIALDPPVDLSQVSLPAALLARRSCDGFDDQPLTAGHLATLLGLGCGVSDPAVTPPRRTAPSAGGLYAIETYLLARAVDGVEAGVWHYEPLAHALEHVRPFPDDHPLRAVLQPGLFDATPAAAVVLTARLSRSQAKYAERAYRFAFLEAGHLGQNLSLLATALGIGHRCIGGFCDDGVNELLGLDGESEATVYLVLLDSSPPTPY